jgi:UDP-glucuronate 4-epimerase
MQPGDVKRTFADISKARNILGYNSKTTLESGLSRFFNWYIHNL